MARTSSGKIRRTRKGAARRTRAAAVGKAAPAAGADGGSVYRYRDDEVERFLRSQENTAVLEEYFGPGNYRELRDLAQEAAHATVRGGPRVLILPGIMGSKLGRRRKLLDDVIWIDPIDILAGNLLKLALGAETIDALGVILFVYLKLKLRLKIAGYDADFHPFDWRLSLDDLGAQLLDRIAAEPADKVHIVAHSMGGLVTRAALAKDGGSKIGRFIMLGTPNYGSFSPVQALTASHPLVHRVAAVDRKNSAADLATKVFKTFPGLSQMLPSPERFNRVDLYDLKTWPAGPGPDPHILAGVRAVQEGLAAADERFFLIAGINKDTITGLRIETSGGQQDFVYETTPDGDGTVPLAFCELPGAKTYYVAETHGSLPNNRLVGEAVIEILDSGATTRLAPRVERGVSRRVRSIPAAALRHPKTPPFEGRRGQEISRAELRTLLQEFASPDAAEVAPLPAAGPAIPRAAASEPPGDYSHRFAHVVVGRRQQRPLEIRLALGDITEVKTRAYVLGVFKEVDPVGAAAAIDAQLDGAVKEFSMRRMFAAQMGEVFAMPTGRHRMFADSVLFVGLGTFDSFNSEVQQFVAENIVRTFIRTHVEDFATVLLGAGSGTSVARSVYNHLVGFFRGLADADHFQDIRRITLCEYQRERFMEMKEEVYRLASTDLFKDVQVTFDEIELPPAPPPPAARRARVSVEARLAYLIVRQEPAKPSTYAFRSSILTAGAKAAVLTGVQEIERAKLNAHLGRIEGQRFTFDALASFGDELARLVLFPDVIRALHEMREYHLVVVHDAAASRVPWETLCIDGWFPAATCGLSRRYAAENLSVAKWLEQRRYGDQLDVLLVVNPNEGNPQLSLAGAVEEAERIKSLFPASNRVRLQEMRGAAATRSALLSAFRSGQFDVVHYAGHAQFNAEEPSLSGILCSDAMLTGADLASLSSLPALVFFNACEAARVRGGKSAMKKVSVAHRIETNVGLAEAFLRGGVANYIGTYWPVGDEAASTFAATFYQELLKGEPVGAALNAGRKRVLELKSVDWADYVHYGSYDFVVKNL